jgi:hypothetical protein
MALMRSRLPRIFRISTLILAIGVAILWPLSYAFFPVAGREAYSGIGTELIAMRGLLIFYDWNTYAGNPPDQELAFNLIPASSRMGSRLQAEFGTAAASTWLARRGFVAISGARYGPQSSVTILMLPQWLVLLVLASPAVGHRLRQRSRRHAPGAKPCKRCGYDLRASPERCPECGAIPGEAAAT